MSYNHKQERAESLQCADKADQYTTALGSYCEWDRNVNLEPVQNTKAIPEEDKNIYNYYDALQYTLYETNHPETVDRTSNPRRYYTDKNTTIAILSSPVECVAILLEGGRQCPGDMLLVMSTTWLSKTKSNRDKNLHSLYVHKAITFDSAGQTFIDTFEPPRRVTYFVNFFTFACTDGQRGDGEIIEYNLDCAMSSSLNLVRKVDDKIWTRILMSEAGMYYPETLAFAYRPSFKYIAPSNCSIKVVKLVTKDGVENLLKEEVQGFLEANRHIRKIVVKPSGIIWHGSAGVSYHDSGDIEGICVAFLKLLQDIDPGDGILVEGFYAPWPQKSKGQENLSFRLRSNVCRGKGNVPKVTTLICGIGNRNRPINGDNTQPQSFESTLTQWGLLSESKRLRELVCRGSEQIFHRIIFHENGMTATERGGVGAQTDVIGIDFVLGEKEGQLVPIGIEVNSHDCTINCQLFEFINTKYAGASVRPLVETMVERSQQYLIQGKTVIVIGAGGISKRFIWPAAKNYGVKVILLDHEDCDEYAKNHVYKFLGYDFTDHTEDEQHAKNIVQMLHEDYIEIDGCCTFWEDCAPLAARVCNLLDLPGPGVDGACIAKKKSLTQNTLSERQADIPHFPRTYLYSAKCVHIDRREDISQALLKIGKPCVLKLEYGSSAVGVKLINNTDDCVAEYTTIQNKLRCESDHPGIGLGHGNSMMIMEYLEGTEHDIDVVIYRRKLVAAFVSDNGPTRKGQYTETAASMPSCLPEDKANQLTIAAYQCCTEIGLISGVFNVEMKMTPTGPKLLEINARMGGFYLRDWINKCYGVDLLLTTFLIACGIKPLLPKSVAQCHMMGVMCVPSAHAHLMNERIKQKIVNLEQTGEIRYNSIEEDILPNSDNDMEEPLCNIAVIAPDLQTAKDKLMEVCYSLKIHNSSYNVSNFVKDFI